MRLIDVDALKKDWRMGNKCDECERDPRACQYYDYMLRMSVCSMLDDAPTVGGWISVKDSLPESGKHVHLSCEIRLLSGRRKQYTCVGFYAKAHTLSEGSYPEDDEAYDYDEEEDEYYLKEGWYEVIHNWDEYSSIVIGDFVTHWMPLPKPPEAD